MKKLLFVAALSTGVFFACQKDSFNSDSASNETIDERGGGGGRCLRGDTIDVAELPASVGAYVDTAYAGATIDLAVTKPNGFFAVELSTGDILIFNADGAFVRPCAGDAGPGGHHPGRRCMRGDSIGVADLPAAVTTYINDNYAGSTIDRAVVKSNGFYAVKLSTGEILIFSETGAFLNPCNAQGPGNGGGGNHCLRGDTIATSDLPAAVSAYVDTAYAGATITVAVVKPNGYYVVELSTGDTLVFNADGEFIRPCDGDGPGHGPGSGPHGPGNGPGNGGNGPGNGGNGGHGHHGHGG